MSLLRTPAGTPTATRTRSSGARGLPTIPDVETCLAVSPIESRRRLIRAAAEETMWNSIVVESSRELLRMAFLHRSSLVWIDMPPTDGEHDDEVADLQSAVAAIRRGCKGLLVVSTNNPIGNEECWARSLGAWAYLPDVTARNQISAVLDEAILALQRSQQRR